MITIPIIAFNQLLFHGGILPMVILTVLLVLLFLSAWKAPNWVKEIGLAALAVSALLQAGVWIHSIDVILQCDGNISPLLLWNGALSTLIVIAYGIVIYLISLVLRIVNKARI